MPWVKGEVSGEVTQDGRIIAVTDHLEVVRTPKPSDREAATAAGLDVDILKNIHEKRPPGKFHCTAYFGGATAMLVPWLALAGCFREDFLARLLAKYYGYLSEGERVFPDLVAIMHVRNTGAPARQNDAEPSGGMAESVDLVAEQIGEMVEMGVRNDKGWTRFLLPDKIKACQGRFDGQQRAAWRVLKRSFPRRYETRLELLSVGQDSLNGQSGIVTVGPVGDFEITSVAQLHLQGTGWKFVDVETMWVQTVGQDDYNLEVPLCRHMVAIAPRPGRSPVVFQLDSGGSLDEYGHHFVLDGENLELAVTHVGKAVLEALGWMK